MSVINFLAAFERLTQDPPHIPGGSCSGCGGIGAVRIPASDGEIELPCPLACDTSKTRLDRLRRACLTRGKVPASYHAMLLSDFANLSLQQRLGKLVALAAAQEFLAARRHQVGLHAILERVRADVGRLPDSLAAELQQPDVLRYGIVWQGALGVGKTALAVAVMNALLTVGCDVNYVRVYDVMLNLKATWKEGDELERLEQYQQAPILILDEFNLTTPDEEAPRFQMEWATSIMRYREGAKLPTLITLNITPEQFAAQWGGQCADVVQALCHWIPMGGVKLRQTQQPITEAF